MKTTRLFISTISIAFLHISFFHNTFEMNINSTSSQHRRVLLTPRIDLTLDVIIDGEDGLPPVILLPSSIRSSDDFDDVAERIAKAGYLVLRPQPRGIDASRGLMENLTLHVLADDVATTIRELGNGYRSVIVGHAFGHYIARVTDLDYPQLVCGIIIAVGEQRYQNDSSLVVSLDRASNETLPQDERLLHLYHAFFAPNSDASVWLTGWHSELRSVYREAAKIPAKNEWWPVSHAPILDLQAANDPWRPPESRNELKDALGSLVTIQVIEEASHALFPEQPKKVADAIVNWIETLN
jgi:pimeloyl-ACP methyl ester carboxylesterase